MTEKKMKQINEWLNRTNTDKLEMVIACATMEMAEKNRTCL